MSVRSQFSPASRRADKPAATSAPSTEFASSTVSKPVSRTSCASTSTRGCGSGASSSASSATYTREAPNLPASSASARTSLPITAPATSPPPRDAAFERTATLGVSSSFPVFSKKTGVFIASDEPLLRQELDDLLRGVAVVLDLPRVAARRRIVQPDHFRPRSLGADACGLRAEVRERERLLRLRLRAHDPLEGRIARLVDRVGDGDDGRERCLDHVVPELRLPLHRQLAVGMRELGRLRDHREAEPVGDGGPEDPAVGVAGLLAEQDDVDAFALQCLRDRIARRDEIGACGGLVADENRTIGAHCERLAERVLRLRRAERHQDDLAVPRSVLQPERFLDRVRVERVQRALARAMEALRAGMYSLRALRPRRDADGDLHRLRTLTRSLRPPDADPVARVCPFGRETGAAYV